MVLPRDNKIWISIRIIFLISTILLFIATLSRSRSISSSEYHWFDSFIHLCTHAFKHSINYRRTTKPFLFNICHGYRTARVVVFIFDSFDWLLRLVSKRTDCFYCISHPCFLCHLRYSPSPPPSFHFSTYRTFPPPSLWALQPPVL